MRLRVVCGFDVTMAIFCPTSRFTSVDFPALGRPTTATNPERNSFFSGTSSFATDHSSLRWFATSVAELLPWFLIPRTLSIRRDGLHLFANAHAQHFSLVGFQHFKAMIREIDFVAGRRHFA